MTTDSLNVINPPTCETCPYWEEPYNEGDQLPRSIDGVCHRRSPQIPPTQSLADEGTSICGSYTGLTYGWHPTTIGSQWCGEHPDFPAYIERRRHAKSV